VRTGRVPPAGSQKAQRMLALPLAEALHAGWQKVQRVLASVWCPAER